MARTVRLFRENASERVRLLEAEEFSRQQREQESEQQRIEREKERKELMDNLADDFEKSIGGGRGSVRSPNRQFR